MSKQVSFDKAGMDKMMAGFDVVSNAVMRTLGPKGLNVYIDRPQEPEITNDGATIAQNIELEGREENMGANIVRNTSSQTNDNAGDGTTTTAVLLHAIVHECLKRPENPMDVMDSLNDAVGKALKALKKQSIKITKKDIERVVSISAEDKKLTKVITEIFSKLGEKPTVIIEDSRTFDTEYEVIEGYEANVGFLDKEFINDKKKTKCELTDALVFVSEKKISNVADITQLQNQLFANKIGSLVVVCEDIEDAMLGVYTNSKKLGLFNAVVIRATGDLLKDIEAATGATRFPAPRPPPPHD